MTKLKKNRNAHQPIDCLHEARTQGFAYLTPDEHRLIETLRWTTHAGRTIIYTLAQNLRRALPWEQRV